jgi:hypothetical protein
MCTRRWRSQRCSAQRKSQTRHKMYSARGVTECRATGELCRTLPASRFVRRLRCCRARLTRGVPGRPYSRGSRQGSRQVKQKNNRLRPFGRADRASPSPLQEREGRVRKFQEETRARVAQRRQEEQRLLEEQKQQWVRGVHVARTQHSRRANRPARRTARCTPCWLSRSASSAHRTSR